MIQSFPIGIQLQNTFIEFAHGYRIPSIGAMAKSCSSAA